MRAKDTKERVAELERKIAELEKESDVLKERYHELKKDSNVLLQKYGHQINMYISDEVEFRMDNIEFRILKKLVDGKYFELKMREKKGDK